MAITYGFQLMTSAESPRLFFRFLNNRTINFKKLEGVVYDFACGLHRYALNREPLQFEKIRFFVDGSHWTSTRKDKKKTKTGDGHLGCSNGYNFNVYKACTDSVSVSNSQGREQLHSVLDKLSKSLRQKNYHNWFRYMIAFFAIRNLMSMKKL